MARLTGTYNMTVNQGATFRLPMRLWGCTEDEPIDLTGYEALLQVRRAPGLEIITELSTENGKITLGGDEGTILLELTAEETALLIPHWYFYDLLMKAGSESVSNRLLEGIFEVRPAITVREIDEPELPNER